MRCKACGEVVPADASYCGNCGARVGRTDTGSDSFAPEKPFIPVPPPLDEAEASSAPDLLPPTRIMPTSGSPTSGRSSAPGTAREGLAQGGPVSSNRPPPTGAQGQGPNGGGRRGLWIAIAALAVAVVVVAVAVPLVVARSDETATSTTTATSVADSSTTTATSLETTSTTEAETSTTVSSSTSTTTGPGDPGDSSGEWVEMQVPDAPGEVIEVSVSETMLLTTTRSQGSSQITAYNFETGEATVVPIEAPEFGGIDLDGSTAVWWEGVYNEADNTYSEQHIYAYDMPDGPRVEIAGGNRNVYYPQTAGLWVTWIEEGPWEDNPEEYWQTPIYGALLPDPGESVGEPIELSPYAVAWIMGDAVWVYSLSEKYLAWEQAAPNGDLDSGTYVLDLSDISSQPGLIGTEAWRPSLSEETLVYWENGLRAFDLTSGEGWDIDPQGDFPTAGPTFAVYFRPTDGAGETAYEIVATGFNGNHEQVLARQSDPPWFSPSIAASAAHVAFVADGGLHVFEWKEQ
jgi:hypothetical protein